MQETQETQVNQEDPLEKEDQNPVILQELTVLSVPHHSDSDVQSHDIQPSEQGCDWSTEKIIT